MSVSQIQRLVDKYREAFEVHEKAGFDGAKNVRVANRAADRLRKIAFEVAKLGNSERRHFAALLDSDNLSLRAWAAHHLLEVIGAGEFESKALQVIEQHAASDSIDAPGERLWLRHWRSSRVDE